MATKALALFAPKCHKAALPPLINRMQACFPLHLSSLEAYSYDFYHPPQGFSSLGFAAMETFVNVFGEPHCAGAAIEAAGALLTSQLDSAAWLAVEAIYRLSSHFVTAPLSAASLEFANSLASKIAKHSTSQRSSVRARTSLALAAFPPNEVLFTALLSSQLTCRSTGIHSCSRTPHCLPPLTCRSHLSLRRYPQLLSGCLGLTRRWRCGVLPPKRWLS